MPEIKECPVCGESIDHLFQKDGYPIGRCPNCELLMVTDVPVEAEIEAIYTTDYYERDPTRYGLLSAKHRLIWLRRLRSIEHTLDSQISARRILDIGCGTGTFLKIAQERGWEVVGVEISSDAAAIAERKVGHGRISSNVFDLADSELFDAVTAWAVIEHLTDPIRYLCKAHSLLKPGGVLAIATVNTDAWNRKIFGQNWRYFTPPEHVTYYNAENLKTVLVEVGFRIESLNTIFSELAFWQGIPLPQVWDSTLAGAAMRKLVNIPMGVASSLFRRGDILEILASRI